jgi:hypothetical protein
MGYDNGRLVRVSLHAIHNVDADNQVNTLHYDLVDQGVDGANSPQALADRFRDDVIPAFAHLYNADWNIQPVVVAEEKDPLNPTRPRQEWASGISFPGTYLAGTGDKLPRACCFVTKLITDHIGRRATGRMFVGGTTYETDQADGLWLSGGGEPFHDRVGAFISSIPFQPDLSPGIDPNTHAFWCVYSRVSRADPVAASYSFGVKATAGRVKVHWLRSRA